jgi:death-on-curing protein
MIKFTNEQAIKLQKQLIAETGGEYGLRDVALLESALSSPFQTFDGIDLFPNICEKAARLGYGLIENHPFVDGNKRIGTHLMLLFLYFNGVELEYSQSELSGVVLNVASGEKGYEELVDWIINHKV